MMSPSKVKQLTNKYINRNISMFNISDWYIKYLYYAAGLNKRFNKVWFCPPLYWSAKNRKFEYNSDYKFKYLTLTLVLKIVSVLLCSLVFSLRNIVSRNCSKISYGRSAYGCFCSFLHDFY